MSLIGGLDEHERNKVEMTNFFRGVCKIRNMKCYVSSRSHWAFSNYFADQPFLRLEGLAHDDIETYAPVKIRNNERVEKLEYQRPNGVQRLE